MTLSDSRDTPPSNPNNRRSSVVYRIQHQTYIAQNIAERCQKYFLYFIAIEILPQHFCKILQNISSQHYNLNFLKYFWKQINIQYFEKYRRNISLKFADLTHFNNISKRCKWWRKIFFFYIIFLKWYFRNFIQFTKTWAFSSSKLMSFTD